MTRDPSSAMRLLACFTAGLLIEALQVAWVRSAAERQALPCALMSGALLAISIAGITESMKSRSRGVALVLGGMIGTWIVVRTGAT